MSRPIDPDDWERWCTQSADEWDEDVAELGSCTVENREDGVLTIHKEDGSISHYKPDMVRIKNGALEIRQLGEIIDIDVKANLVREL